MLNIIISVLFRNLNQLLHKTNIYYRCSLGNTYDLKRQRNKSNNIFAYDNEPAIYLTLGRVTRESFCW